MQNNRDNQTPKKEQCYCFQFSYPGKTVLITSTKGRPLYAMAKGVSEGVHWAVYKTGPVQPHGEVRIENGTVRIVKVLPQVQEVWTIWEAVVGKDGRRPPFGWQEAVDTALSMATCSGKDCNGHWPLERVAIPATPIQDRKETILDRSRLRSAKLTQLPKSPQIPQKPLPTPKKEIELPNMPDLPNKAKILERLPAKLEEAKPVEIFAAKKVPDKSEKSNEPEEPKTPVKRKRGRPPKES